MSDDTLSNNQMDAAVEAVDADTQRVFGEMKIQGPAMMRVSVVQDGATAYESVYAIKEAGDMETAVSDAVANARRKVHLRAWGWTVTTNKA